MYKTAWTQERLGRCPQPLEELNPSTYIQRRNIKEVHEDGEDGSPKDIYWTCESRVISKESYEIEVAQLDTMEAIAEVYEMVEQLVNM